MCCLLFTFLILPGKLHRHIVQLQVSEGTAVKKLEDCMKKITKLQAQLLRTEQRLDEKDQALLHHRAETANKSRHLRSVLLGPDILTVGN